MYKITDEDFTEAKKSASKHHEKCRHIDVNDLIQVAQESLYTSLRSYDPDKGEFINYARKGIKQAMTDFVKEQDKETHYSEVYETVPDQHTVKYTLDWNYDLLTQDKCDLWDDLNRSGKTKEEYAELNDIVPSTFYSRIKRIEEKLIRATTGGKDR